MIVAFLAVLIFVKPATKTPEPIAQPTTSKTEKPAGGCDVPLGDTSSKPAMPKDLRWEAAKGVSWPVSDTYGPTQDKDGYGVCFARTPLGAALTMATFSGLTNTHDSKKTVEIYTIESTGKKQHSKRQRLHPVIRPVMCLLVLPDSALIHSLRMKPK